MKLKNIMLNKRSQTQNSMSHPIALYIRHKVQRNAFKELEVRLVVTLGGGGEGGN